MIRRLFTAASVLSLLVGVALIVAYGQQVPSDERRIGDPDDGWSITFHLGMVMVGRSTGGVLASAPWFVSLEVLALPLVMWPLALGVVISWPTRRHGGKGFAIEPMNQK